jgi:hypothetical protein
MLVNMEVTNLDDVVSDEDGDDSEVVEDVEDAEDAEEDEEGGGDNGNGLKEDGGSSDTGDA